MSTNRQPLDKNGVYTIETPYGTLLIYATDPNYPGVGIDLELPSGEQFPIAIVESDSGREGRITSYVYDNPDHDDYSHKVVYKNIPCFCKSCGKELNGNHNQINKGDPDSYFLCLDCVKSKSVTGNIQMCFLCGEFFTKEAIDSHSETCTGGEEGE